MKNTEKIYLMDIARDIVVAKLSQTSPNYTNKEIGENIADMYEAIYNRLSTIHQSSGKCDSE